MEMESLGAPGAQCRSCLCLPESCHPLPVHRYFYCTNLEVTMDDGLPSVLCANCYDLLDRLYYFKQQCVRSDSLLKEHVKLQPQFVKMDEMNEKEIKTDFYILENRSMEQQDEMAKTIVDVEEQLFENSKDCNISADSDANEKFISSPDTDVNTKDDDCILEKRRKKCKKSKLKKSSTMLYCQKCDKSFYKYVKLEAHMRKHFGMKPDSAISCSQCNKKFTTEKNLKSHLRVHTGERKYKCKTCGKAFAYLNVLKNHERAHAGIKKYVCHECGKKFVQLTNLNTHLLQHTGEKPYICEPCNRRFGQPSEYKLHMLRHTGVKNFACSLCPLRFYTNANLQKHMGVHSDVRPYACKTCEKRFKTRSYMAVHNRTHTGERPFSCDYCPMKFMSGKDRRNHHKTHTGEKAPPKPRKPKVQSLQTNQESTTDILQNNPQLQLHDQNINIGSSLDQIVTNVSIDNSYMPQHDVHTLSPVKLIPKQNCSYDTIKSLEKQSPNNYFRIPPASKTQCSYLNPMY